MESKVIMSLAIFDLDNTLLADDSDFLWGQFLVDQGIVDATFYKQENERFYQQYKQGKLDIHEFLNFSLKPLADNAIQDLYHWREQFIEEVIRPILLQPAQELINRHKRRGDILLVITATNKFVTEPIVNLYGISHLLATTAELIDGKYTGRVAGIPCFQGGKVSRLNEWLKETGYALDDSWFYSDSHNDLPLLQLVEHPVAVDPDDKLKCHADKSGWPVISLRGEKCPTYHFK